MVRRGHPPKLARTLEERFQQAGQLFEQGEVYGGIVQIGEIAACISQLRGATQGSWRRRIRSIHLVAKERTLIRKSARKEFKRLQRIFSAGGKFTEEEIVLVLTIRIQLEILRDYFSRHHAQRPDFQFEKIDQKLETLALSAENKRAYATAYRLIGRNWGLPLHGYWERFSFATGRSRRR